MNISSVVLRTRYEDVESVRRLLAALPGVEVHAATDDGRLVITLEDAGADSAADTFVKLHDIAGVMSVAMIYQYAESTEIRSQES